MFLITLKIQRREKQRAPLIQLMTARRARFTVQFVSTQPVEHRLTHSAFRV
jgi:hypothetical protein